MHLCTSLRLFACVFLLCGSLTVLVSFSSFSTFNLTIGPAPIPFPSWSPAPSPVFSSPPVFVGPPLRQGNATVNFTSTSSPSSAPFFSADDDFSGPPDDDFFGPPQPPWIGDPFGDGLLAPWTDPINQDNISEAVAITRDYRGGIFNALVEGDYWSECAPTGTRWALLPENKTFEEARCELRFCSWLECFAQYDVRSMLNKPGILHLTKEDEYYNIMFTNWTTNRGDDYMFKSRKLQPDKTETREAARKRRLQFDGPRPEEPPRWNECEYEEYDYDIGELGGGFQYVRDEFPIVYNDETECPRCSNAKASPSELTGPVDESFVEVGIEGVTPEDDVEIKILAVAQESNPKCNRAPVNSTSTDPVRPNAMGLGNSTTKLRRTLPVGSVNPMRYTIYYMATNEAGTCKGQVEACSPLEGLKCDDYIYGYDATATEYCEA